MAVSVQFVVSDRGQDAEATRLGGQPSWLEGPSWPVSRSTGEPMWFIGQFRIQGRADGGRLAYVFMTNAAGYADDAWEYDAGENAVIVQPGGTIPGFVSVSSDSTGPTCGLAAFPEPCKDPAFEFNRIGGDPVWMQADETPEGGQWRLVAQLDSTALPFPVNFGDAGHGYVFVGERCSEGRFLWQGC